MSVALALLTSLLWGAADFLGGATSRRFPVGTVALVSQAAGALALVPVVLVRGAPVPAVADLLPAVGAGLAGAAAVFVFYRGLSRGVMSIVAPVATASALVPVVVGVAGGERPALVAYAGMVAVIAGVALVGAGPANGPLTRARVRLSVGYGLLAALGIGAFLVGLDASAPGDPFWVLLAARLTACAVTAAVVVPRLRGAGAVRSSLAGPAVLVGVLDVAANACFVLASREGLLSVVTVLSSLYPAVTVLLARVWLGERVTRWQDAGLVVALAGVALVALP